MDIRKIVSRGELESRHLKYVADETEKQTIVETLVGMSNSEGGSVVVGVEVGEDGNPRSFTDLQSRCSVVGEIDNKLSESVAPPLECRTELFRIGGSRFVSFTVPPSDRLRSVQDEAGQKPVFPARFRSERAFLSGNDIDHFLELSSARPS